MSGKETEVVSSETKHKAQFTMFARSIADEYSKHYSGGFTQPSLGWAYKHMVSILLAFNIGM
jgi:hypothetical protein